MLRSSKLHIEDCGGNRPLVRAERTSQVPSASASARRTGARAGPASSATLGARDPRLSTRR
jgi:hypothetical protein